MGYHLETWTIGMEYMANLSNIEPQHIGVSAFSRIANNSSIPLIHLMYDSYCTSQVFEGIEKLQLQRLEA